MFWKWQLKNLLNWHRQEMYCEDKSRFFFLLPRIPLLSGSLQIIMISIRKRTTRRVFESREVCSLHYLVEISLAAMLRQWQHNAWITQGCVAVYKWRCPNMTTLKQSTENIESKNAAALSFSICIWTTIGSMIKTDFFIVVLLFPLTVVWGDCNHSFHNCCMSLWIVQNPRCPLCQANWSVQRLG